MNLSNPVFRTRWLVAALVVATLAIVAPGCFGGAEVERTYYSLTYPMEKVENRAGHRYPVRLLMRRFDADLAYSKQEIVYRANPYEFSYYNYRSWSSKPSKLLQAKVSEHLRRARIVTGIDDRIGNQLPDYEMQGEVIAIEELNTTEELWYARLAMRLTLVRFADREVVWSYQFDERKRAVERSPVHVVRMMSEIFEEQMAIVVGQLDTYFGSVVEGTVLAPKMPVSTNPKPDTREKPPETPRARLLE